MTRSRAIAQPAACDLAGLPGARARRVLARILPPDLLSGVVDPALADAHAEWFEAPDARARRRVALRARWTLACSLACLVALAAARASGHRFVVWSGAGAITAMLLLTMQVLIAPGPPAPRAPEPPPLAIVLPPDAPQQVGS